MSSGTHLPSDERCLLDVSMCALGPRVSSAAMTPSVSHDAERDVIDPCAATSASFSQGGLDRIATADDHVADVADQAFVLAAFVIRRSPTQKVRVKGNALLVIGR